MKVQILTGRTIIALALIFALTIIGAIWLGASDVASGIVELIGRLFSGE